MIMAGTFSQLYIQVVFAVKRREHLLQKPWRDEAFKYMAGVIKEKGQKPIIVNGVAISPLRGLVPSHNVISIIITSLRD